MRRGPTFAEGLVARRDLGDQDRTRPTVEGDVVDDEEKEMISVRAAKEDQPKQRSLLVVEMQPPTLAASEVYFRHPFDGIEPRQIQHGEFNGRGGVDYLDRPIRAFPEVRPQDLMPIDDLLHRLPQAVDVQRTFEADQRRQVVGGDRQGFEPPALPEALLGQGQWRWRASLSPEEDGLAFPTAGGQHRFYERRLIGQTWPIEEATQRQFDSEGLPHSRNQPGRDQRVPADLEKVVVQPNLGRLEHFGPDPGQDLLDGRPRRTSLPNRSGELPRVPSQLSPIDLAIRR